jgi:hypothetical protein
MRWSRFLIAVLLLFALAEADAGDFSSNEYVRLEVRPVPGKMRPGSSGHIELRFLPSPGIHVNADPPVAFSLDSAGAAVLKGKPVITKDSTTGYLSTTVPVRQEMALPRKTAPGQLTVRGTVTYYYCSDDEGWCNREKEPVEFTIAVVP